MTVALVGCGQARDATDGGVDGIDGAPGDPDAAIPGEDGGSEDGGPIGFDTGPPETCERPGALETVPCGRCGEVDRFCTAARVWEYGTCSGEGMCEPGTLGTEACGSCGSQATRCTVECAWERVGSCTGEGVCEPGSRMRSGEGCAAGQTRELLCGDTCSYAPAGACEADGCPTPGALENVPCGRCGSRQRFCTTARVWEYGACSGEGVCEPGTTGSVSCGMCGSRAAFCTTSCTWSPTGSCTGEGVCTPGTTTRTAMGCPAGQTRLVRCGDSCAYSTTVEACSAASPVDVMVLLDVTGSHATYVRDNRALLGERLVTPLLGIADVTVGVSWYADFPVSSYGSPGDRPFEGAVEPTRTRASIDAALARTPLWTGGDGPESGVEALSILHGGAVPASAIALSCSSGRAAGGCWRPGARRVVVLYTDAPQHNGPDPSGVGLFSPYTGISPEPATWPAVRTAMTAAGGTILMVLVRGGASDATSQHARMLSDLGRPASDLVAADALGPALDAVVARVRAIAMP